MNNLAKVAIALLVIVLSVFFIFRSTRPPRGSASNHEFTGARLGAELTRACGEKGGKVLVVGFAGERPVMTQQIDGFLNEIRKSPALQFVGREDIDPNAQGEGMIMEGGGVPPAAMAECLAAHPDADILVSFVGLPNLRDAKLSAALAKGLRLVVVNANAVGLSDLVERRVVFMAVVNKAVDMSQFTRKPESPAAWFDRFFEIASAAPAAAH